MLDPCDEVAAVFAAYPATICRKFMVIRKLILEVAEATDGVGAIEETLKWGEPAYLTAETRSGSTIRLGWKASAPSEYAVYFNCNTNLVETFRSMFPDTFRFEGNRKIAFELRDKIPSAELSLCIEAALTYHSSKKTSQQV